MGFWWLPDSQEHQVPGRIELAEDGRSSLDIIQAFNEPVIADKENKDTRDSGSWRDVSAEVLGIQEQEPSSYLILGQTATGQSVTLKDCSRTHNFSNPKGGFPHSSFEAMVTIIGEHFKRAEDIRAKRLILRYSHLSEWVGGVGDPTKDDGTVLAAKADDCEVRLRLPEKRGRPFARGAEITVEFPDKKSLDVLVKAADKVQDLLTFGVRSSVRPLDVWWQSGFGEEPTASPIYFPWRRHDGEDETVDRYKMLFSLAHAPGGFSKVIERWMGCYDELGPPLRLYFGMAYIPPGYVDQKVALLVNFLEGYHRRAKRFQIRRSRTQEKKMTLCKRLNEILEEYPESVRLVIGGEDDKESFVKEAKDFRNFRNHFFYGRQSPNSEATVRLCKELVKLVEICLLGEIGFEDHAIKERLENPNLTAHPLFR